MTLEAYLSPYKSLAGTLCNVPSVIYSDNEASSLRSQKQSLMEFRTAVKSEITELDNDLKKCGNISSNISSIDTSEITNSIVRSQTLIKNNFIIGDFYPGESSISNAASSMASFITIFSKVSNAVSAASNDIGTAQGELNNIVSNIESAISKIGTTLSNWEIEKARQIEEARRKAEKE